LNEVGWGYEKWVFVRSGIYGGSSGWWWGWKRLMKEIVIDN